MAMISDKIRHKSFDVAGWFIFLLTRQNKIKHHSVTNHIYENISPWATFLVVKMIVKFWDVYIYAILDSTLLSFALLWMFWFWQFTTHKRVKIVSCQQYVCWYVERSSIKSLH